MNSLSMNILSDLSKGKYGHSFNAGHDFVEPLFWTPPLGGKENG